MQAAESRQPRREPEGGERIGGRDRQRPARVAKPVGRRVDLRERRVRDQVELLSGAGELQAAVHALEERLPDLLLERLDLAADRRLGNEQLMRRAGEAQVARGSAEAPEQVERQTWRPALIHSLNSCER
jgi:hypothetical protein